MIDVKLVSAAATPAQKGVDAWLQTWRLGQQFSGRVLSQSPAGDALIRLGAHQITARAPFTLPVGSAVRFEVSALLPLPQLKLVADKPVGAATADPIGQQLRVLLPMQSSVAAPLARLLLSTESAKLLSLLGLGNDASERLRALLPSLRQLTDPAELQSLLLNAGAFSAATNNAGNDLRLALLRLLQRLAEQRGQQFAGQGLSGPALKAADSAMQSLNGALQGALATLALNQLAMAQAQAADRAAYMWLFDLPYQWRDRAGSLAVKLERERPRQRGRAKKKEEAGWRVTLRLDLATLGAVEVEIFERAGKVSVVLRAQRVATRQLLSEHLPVLQQALAQRGLDVSTMRCYMGDYDPPAGAGDWDQNLSVNV